MVRYGYDLHVVGQHTVLRGVNSQFSPPETDETLTVEMRRAGKCKPAISGEDLSRCWAHSMQAIAIPSVTRCRCRCGHRFYIAIHQVSLLSHAACAIAIAGFGSSW